MINDDKKLTEEQEILSHSIQMSHASQLVHEIGMLDVFDYPEHGKKLGSSSDTIVGNKMALLCGDLFLAKTCLKTSILRFEG